MKRNQLIVIVCVAVIALFNLTGVRTAKARFPIVIHIEWGTLDSNDVCKGEKGFCKLTVSVDFGSPWTARPAPGTGSFPVEVDVKGNKLVVDFRERIPPEAIVLPVLKMVKVDPKLAAELGYTDMWILPGKYDIKKKGNGEVSLAFKGTKLKKKDQE